MCGLRLHLSPTFYVRDVHSHISILPLESSVCQCDAALLPVPQRNSGGDQSLLNTEVQADGQTDAMMASP